MDDLRAICKDAGASIIGVTHDGKPVDGGLLLWAIAGNESTFGKRRLFVKPEPAYMPGGTYYGKSMPLRSAYYQYGVLAASSFGSFQVMYPTACELGFNGHPIFLQDDENCAKYAAKLIADRCVARGAIVLSQVLDAYNSGSAKDANVPGKYIEDGIHFYEQGWGQ